MLDIDGMQDRENMPSRQIWQDEYLEDGNKNILN